MIVSKGSIGNRVWYDSNQNGIQDPGESGAGGISVTLQDAHGKVVASTTTDSSGNYLFGNLHPGQYRVQFGTVANGSFTVAHAGTDASLDSDADANGLTPLITLHSGELNRSTAAGLIISPPPPPPPPPAATARVGDHVWLDANGNGAQDSGESGAAGVAVALKDATGNVLAATTTDANGNYLFTSLVAGQYQVQFGTLPNYQFTGEHRGGDTALDSDAGSDGASALFALAAGQSNLTIDAGLVAVPVPPPPPVPVLGSLGDHVWFDANGNGVQDAGEVGAPGVTVRLENAAGTVLSTITTDAHGDYLFTNLAEGRYQVQFGTLPGYQFTGLHAGSNPALDSDAGANGQSQLVTLGAGEHELSIDAGLVVILPPPPPPPPALGSLGDRVWFDANNNGVQDAPESGAAGVTVQLENAAGTVLATTTTDANGYYLFTSLAAGQYEVQFGTLAGYTFTTQHSGTNTALDSDADKTSGLSQLVTLGAGETNLTIDAGLVQRVGALGDHVWFDANNNGIQDAGEAGAAGTTVKLERPDGSVLATTTTDANGNYLFTSLVAGQYEVQFGTLPGYSFTSQHTGTNTAVDSDANQTTGLSQLVTLGAGETNLTIDAGLVQQLGSLGDRVWFDANHNGVQDAPESGAAGVTVQLENAAGTVLATTTTDANGYYLFTGLEAGQYEVQFGTLAGYTFTTPHAGSNPALDSDASTTTGRSQLVALGVGENNLSIDAGLAQVPPPPPPPPPPSGSIGDRVWNDANHNGLQDAGEAGIAGATVKLEDAGGNVLQTATTDSNGAYTFSALAAGQYKLQFLAPTLHADWYAFTAEHASGATPANDSDANAAGLTDLVTLAAGQANTTVDAGLVYDPHNATIGDFVWNDANDNGIQDAGEAGLANVTVKLEDASGTVLLTTTTDANGAYHFSNLGAGNYQVQVVAPSSRVFSPQHATGSTSANDSDVDSNGLSSTVALAVGQTVNTVDAGLYAPPPPDPHTGAIGDTAWFMYRYIGFSRSDGSVVPTQEFPGTVLALVTVSLTGAGADHKFGTPDDYHATTKTDLNGHYSFTGLAAGDYTVSFNFNGAAKFLGYGTPPYPWTSQGPNGEILEYIPASGILGPVDKGVSYPTFGKSAINANYKTDVITLAPGEVNKDVDAGIFIDSSATPIVLDLDGNGIQTSALGATRGTFDLLANGRPVSSGWISSGDAFLAVDTNHNGRIDSRAELFGGAGQHDGFNQLAAYDANHDGVVDAKDAGFGKLLVWQDLNGNHQSDPGELRTLAQAGIASLKVAYTSQLVDAGNGNALGDTASATRADGSSIAMTDVWLQYAPAVAATAPALAPAPAVPASPLHDLLTPGDVLLDHAFGPGTHHVAAHGSVAVDDGELGRRLAHTMQLHAALTAN